MATQVARSVWMLAAAVVVLCFGARARGQCEGRWLPGEASSSIPGAVNALAEWDPDGPGPQSSYVLLGGNFARTGGWPNVNIAGWDGDNWLNVGAAPGLISNFAVHQDQLFAVSNSIFRRVGSTWQSIGAVSGSISCMLSYRGDLIVAGYLGRVGTVNVRGIARWDGSAWHELGGGVSNAQNTAQVSDMCVVGDDLVIVGSFTQVGQTSAEFVARWNGTEWSAFHNSLDYIASAGSVALFEGVPVVFGQFLGPNGMAFDTARWTAAGWERMGNPGPVFGYQSRIKVFGDTLYFCRRSSQPLVRWNGRTWEPITHRLAGLRELFSGVMWNGEPLFAGEFRQDWESVSTWRLVRVTPDGLEVVPKGVSSKATSFWPYENYLVIGGNFGAAGGESVGRVVRWDGEAWWPMGTLYSPPVFSKAFGNLFASAGGAFEWSGSSWVPRSSSPLLYAPWNESWAGAAGYRVLDWNGQAWQPLGADFMISQESYGSIYALREFQGSLYAGGSFTRVGTVPVSGLARWNGSQWVAVAPGFGTVYAMTEFNGELIAVGNGVSGWDGATKRDLATGLNGEVTNVAVYNGTLAVIGAFTTIGGVQASHIARWDGIVWRPLGTGLTVDSGNIASILDGLGVYNGELIAGSNFLLAGGENSPFFARWTDTNTPWFARQPEDSLVSLREAGRFAAVPATGYGPLTHRWQMEDPPVPGGWRDLSGGPLMIAGQEVGTVSGASTDTLTITPTFNFGGAILRAIVANACGEATSELAVLTVANCDADINCDGVPDQGDIACLILALAGDSSCFCQADPDFNLDGVPDQDDVAAVILVVAGGECP